MKMSSLDLMRMKYTRSKICVLNRNKIEWRKHVFEYKLKNTYGIENQNDMTRIHNKKVSDKAEQNLIHHMIWYIESGDTTVRRFMFITSI